MNTTYLLWCLGQEIKELCHLQNAINEKEDMQLIEHRVDSIAKELERVAAHMRKELDDYKIVA